MVKYLFLIAITMVSAHQNQMPGQPPQEVHHQGHAQNVQNQATQQVPVGQGNQQPNVQQQQILQQQQQQQAVHMQQGQQAINAGKNMIRDKNHIQDREHIKLHLNGVIDDDPEGDMSEKDLQLHYFKAHDYDNNMKLDGLEILQAVSHFHSEGGEDHKTPPLDDQQLMQLIDPILEEDDKNKDGYVDYPEFASSNQ